MEIPELRLTPIGFISTPFADRYSAPRQPGAGAATAEGEITLLPGFNFEQGLADLEGFERIWVIYWFHRNSNWKPKVLPPRGPRTKRGVFATRSPHRPNPIGLSLLRLLGVEGRTIRVGEVDLLDGTPVLDIKPYLPYAEAFPDARMGWLEEIDALDRAAGGRFFTVVWSQLAAEQEAWLRDRHGVALADVAVPILERDPSPHPYRRVSERPDGGGEIAVRSWRLEFTVAERTVTIERIASGYAPATLAQAPAGSLHDHAAHVEFCGRFSFPS